MEPWLVKKGDDTQINSRKRGVILHIFLSRTLRTATVGCA